MDKRLRSFTQSLVFIIHRKSHQTLLIGNYKIDGNIILDLVVARNLAFSFPFPFVDELELILVDLIFARYIIFGCCINLLLLVDISKWLIANNSRFSAHNGN